MVIAGLTSLERFPDPAADRGLSRCIWTTRQVCLVGGSIRNRAVQL